MLGKSKKSKTVDGKSKAEKSEKPNVDKNSNKDPNSKQSDWNDSRTRNASRDATIYTNVLNTVTERQRIRRLEQQNQSDDKQKNSDTSQYG